MGNDNEYIISGLKYLEYFGISLPNDVLGDRLVKNTPNANLCLWEIKFMNGMPYFYGTHATSREDYESGKAISTPITYEDLDNEIFRQNIIRAVEEHHEKVDSNEKFKSECPDYVLVESQLYEDFKSKSVKHHL